MSLEVGGADPSASSRQSATPPLTGGSLVRVGSQAAAPSVKRSNIRIPHRAEFSPREQQSQGSARDEGGRVYSYL